MKKSTKEILHYCLAGIVVMMALIIIVGLFYLQVSESNKDLFNITAGIVLGGFTTVISFFFGSSQGSKDKTEAMANSSVKKSDDQP